MSDFGIGILADDGRRVPWEPRKNPVDLARLFSGRAQIEVMPK